MGLGLVQPLVVLRVHCQHWVGSVVLRGCVMVGEGTAWSGVILGSQLIPPGTVVELPAVWYRCNLIGMTLLCVTRRLSNQGLPTTLKFMDEKHNPDGTCSECN